MANSTSHALPYPIRKARYSLPLTFRVAAGTPTDPTTPDTEVSTDGGATFADCAEEITTGGANGAGYLTLTGAETDNNFLHIASKSANCVTTPAVIQPRNLAIVGSGTLSAGSAGGGTLGTLLAYDVTGCFIRTTGGTGGGGTGGANNQARRIITYNTSTGACTVSPNWETTPDNTTTYDVLLPEGVTLGMLKALNPTTAGATLDVTATGEAGIDWANIGGKTTANALTGTTIATTQKVDIETIKTNPVVNAGTVTFPTSATLASTTNITAGTITTATNLTNAPPDSSGVTTLLSRVPSGIFTGITSLAQWLGLIAGKQVGNTTARTEIRATGAGSGTFDETTDSQEAVRDYTAAASTALSTAQWSNTRAGYLDNLSAGAVAQASTALSSATWTNTRAGYLDNLSAGAVAQASTALSTATWTNARAGYLDNINNSYLGTLSGSNIASAVWNASLSSYVTAGTMGYAANEIDVIYTNAYDGINARLLTNVTHISGSTPASQIASAVTTALTTALTEGYRGTNSTGSVRDLLYEVIAHMGESSISSTTKTLKKIDGSTTAKTYTLNSATAPTSITEAT